MLQKDTSIGSALPPVDQRIKYQKQLSKLKTNLMLSLLFKMVLPKGTSISSASPPVDQRIKYQKQFDKFKRNLYSLSIAF